MVAEVAPAATEKDPTLEVAALPRRVSKRAKTATKQEEMQTVHPTDITASVPRKKRN